MLIEHSQYEIRLGAMAAVKHDDLLFVIDTEGIYPVKYLSENTKKLAPSELGRIFGAKTIPKEVSLTNPWPAGPIVRRSTAYADDLNATPAQLTDAAYFCASVRATGKPEKKGLPSRRHYVGFQRGRIAEQIRSTERSEFSLAEFVAWSRALAKLIQTVTRTPPSFFGRYLSQVPPPPTVVPKYLVINLFEGDIELRDEDEVSIELVDSIIEVGSNSKLVDGALNYAFSLHYCREGETTEKSIEAKLAYDPGAERFRIRGEELNSQVLVTDSRGEPEGLCNYLNHNDEEFTVALDGPDTYYTAQAFYEVDYTHAERQLTSLLKPVADLGTVTTEKGKKSKVSTSWDKNSIFGVVGDYKSSGFISDYFGKPELLLCDDMGTEVADFVCASFTSHKIAFIHAKHGKGRRVSASALHIWIAGTETPSGCQVLRYDAGGLVPRVSLPAPISGTRSASISSIIQSLAKRSGWSLARLWRKQSSWNNLRIHLNETQ